MVRSAFPGRARGSVRFDGRRLRISCSTCFVATTSGIDVAEPNQLHIVQAGRIVGQRPGQLRVNLPQPPLRVGRQLVEYA